MNDFNKSRAEIILNEPLPPSLMSALAIPKKDPTIIANTDNQWLKSIQDACEEFLQDNSMPSTEIANLRDQDLNFMEEVLQNHILQKMRKLDRCLENWENGIPEASPLNSGFHPSLDMDFFNLNDVENDSYYAICDAPNNNKNIRTLPSNKNIDLNEFYSSDDQSEEKSSESDSIASIVDIKDAFTSENQTENNNMKELQRRLHNLEKENNILKKQKQNENDLERKIKEFEKTKSEQERSGILIRALQQFKIQLESKNQELEKNVNDLQKQLERRSRPSIDTNADDIEKGEDYRELYKTEVSKLRGVNQSLNVKINQLQKTVINANEMLKDNEEHIQNKEKQNKVLQRKLTFSESATSTYETQTTSGFLSPTTEIAIPKKENLRIPWYQFFQEEMGDLAYTKTLCEPVFYEAPVTIDRAEKILIATAESLRQQLMDQLEDSLTSVSTDEYDLTEAQLQHARKEVLHKFPWSSGLLQDLSSLSFTIDLESVDKSELVSTLNNILTKQEHVVINKLLNSMKMHFGTTVNTDLVESFKKQTFAEVQEHTMETLSIRVPRTLTPLQQGRILKLACVFDDSVSLSLLAVESEENEPRPFMDDADSQGCCQCGDPFTLTRRRHHCRFCGILVCGRCSGKRCPTKFSKGYSVRVCDRCFLILRIMET